MVRSLSKINDYFSSHPLTREAPHKAWIRFADWQIRSRLQDEVVINWLEGQRLAVRRGMTGATGNIYTGLHEFADMAFLLHFLRREDLFLDIGSNVGSFTVLAAGVCQANSWSFEPDPGTVRHLRRNIEINDLEKRVTVHEMALGEYGGKAEFTVGLDSVNRVLLSTRNGSRTVEMRRLDDIVGLSRPAMIKMDVEGYEEHVLRGAQAALQLDSLKAIEIETLSPGAMSILQVNGFRRAYYDPFNRELRTEAVRVGASNALYIRDWDFVRDRLTTADGFRVFDVCI